MNEYSILNDLASVPDHFSVSLVMRHSNRYPILDPNNVYAARLTPLGIERAEHFGSELIKMGRNNVETLLSTPVERCVDTANAIARGAGWSIQAKTDKTISYPFIEHIWLTISDGGQGRVFQRPPEIQQILNLVLHFKHTGLFKILVTHDSVIACILSYLLGETFDPEGNWIEFLEGFLVWEEDRQIMIRWRGKNYAISSM